MEKRQKNSKKSMENNESFQKLYNDIDFQQKVQDEMTKELYKSLRKD